jgi:hypothetical protein
MLEVLESRVLRKIFGLKGDDVTGDWRRSQNEKFYDLYFSLNFLWVNK